MTFIRAFRMVLGVSALAASLPVLHAGIRLLRHWLLVRSGDVVYVGSESWDYLGKGTAYLIVGCIALVASVMVVFRRIEKFGTLSLACFLGFGGCFSVLFLHGPALHLQIASVQIMSFMSDVDGALFDWAQQHGHFPTQPSEIRFATETQKLNSPFKRAKATLPYMIVFQRPAVGPALSGLPVQHPGTIVCAVSADGREVWITATTLEDAADVRVGWLNQFGKPYVRHARLSDRWYRPPT